MLSTPLVLASASPRRLMLLEQIGIKPTAVDPADMDEAVLKNETPRQYVLRIAAEKGRVVAVRHPGAFVLSGDTSVIMGRRYLHKPETLEQARACWALLPGRKHRILTAISLIAPDGRQVSKLAEASVVFRNMSEPEVESYLDSGEWQGVAGGYKYQGLAARYIRATQGNSSTIIGLPIFETAQLLTSLGYYGR